VRPNNVVNQATDIIWFAPATQSRDVRVARRWRLLMDEGQEREETRYRAETRLAGYDWLPIGDDADWLPSPYSAWARLHAVAQDSRVMGDRLKREIAWFAHNEEWRIGSDGVHEDAIFEDKVRTLAAVAGVDGLLEIVSRGELLEVLLSLRPAE
jgi:hypothetical protein